MKTADLMCLIGLLIYGFTFLLIILKVNEIINIPWIWVASPFWLSWCVGLILTLFLVGIDYVHSLYLRVKASVKCMN